MARDVEEIAALIVDAAIKVHRALGPGLLESAYQHCLAHELRTRGLKVETEVAQPVVDDGERIEAGWRLDMLVEKAIVIENKTVDESASIHEAQLLTYLKLRKCSLGFC